MFKFRVWLKPQAIRQSHFHLVCPGKIPQQVELHIVTDGAKYSGNSICQTLACCLRRCQNIFLVQNSNGYDSMRLSIWQNTERYVICFHLNKKLRCLAQENMNSV